MVDDAEDGMNATVNIAFAGEIDDPKVIDGNGYGDAMLEQAAEITHIVSMISQCVGHVRLADGYLAFGGITSIEYVFNIPAA